MPIPRSRHRGALLGLAAGDAVGTTVEFRARGTFEPLKDMVGGGPFHLQPGEWTDDTSMALCLARSLVDCGGFDPHDQMERYVRWFEDGYLSSNGRCFDIGNTVRAALERFGETGDPFAGATHPRSAGNGSLMRLAPVVLYFDHDRETAIARAAESSRTTHGAPEAVDACRLYAALLLRALRGESKEDVLTGEPASRFSASLSPAVAKIADGAWRKKGVAGIRGGGYVVEALEAALWCVDQSSSFAETVLRAANLGEDADTTAAIAGQIAGALYGDEGIPSSWRRKLVRADEIARLADALAGAHPANDAPFAQSYWASPAGVIGGAYPGDLDPKIARTKVRAILDRGVRCFVNLMESNEVNRDGRPFVPYEPIVEHEAAALGVRARCVRLAVRDLSVPSHDTMHEIQATIDAVLDAGEAVYVHCLGGRGRTGTAVGIHLIRHGQAEPSDFVEAIRQRRVNDSGKGASPETEEQRGFVRAYVEADRSRAAHAADRSGTSRPGAEETPPPDGTRT